MRQRIEIDDTLDRGGTKPIMASRSLTWPVLSARQGNYGLRLEDDDVGLFFDRGPERLIHTCHYPDRSGFDKKNIRDDGSKCREATL